MIRILVALAIALLFVNTPVLAGEGAKSSEAAKSAEATKAVDAAKGAATTATPAAAAQHRAYAPGDLTWSDAPPGLPKGAKVAVLQGDPSTPGLFTMRVMLPAGYRVAPHHHPSDENVTVFSGELYMGLGDTFDETKAHALGSGSFSVMPVGVRHYAFTKAETVFQVHAMGPWNIIYVNPQDDPRNTKQATK